MINTQDLSRRIDEASERLLLEGGPIFFAGMLSTSALFGVISGHPEYIFAQPLFSAQQLLGATQPGAAALVLFAVPIILAMAGFAMLAVQVADKAGMRARTIGGHAVLAFGLAAAGWLVG